MSSYRNVRRHERGSNAPRKTKRGGSPGKFNDWKPPIDSPIWARYFEGHYATCGECKGLVMCAPKGEYTCKNVTHQPDGSGSGVCGHEGAAEFVLPITKNFRAFITGGGRRKKGAYVQCNCWRGRRDVPCVLCHYENELGVTPRSYYAHNVLLLGDFHVVEYDRGDNSGTFMKKEPCQDASCQWCKKGLEGTFGKRVYHNVGYGHYNQLLSWDRQIGQHCSCGKGKIQTMGWVCHSCGDVLADCLDTELDEAAFDALGDEKVMCSQCGQVDYPEEELDCHGGDMDNPQPGCVNPTRLSIFDVDVLIQRSGGEQPVIQIVKWQLPDYELGDVVAPYNFDFLSYQPPPLQAGLMNKENPFGSSSEPGGIARRGRKVRYD